MIIYCTTNLINGKKYIGYDSKNNDSYLGGGVYFTRALKKYGKENFKKQILEHCTNIENLLEAEIYWIDYFGAQKSDLFYNIVEGGGNGYKGMRASEQLKEKLSKSHLDFYKTEKGKIAIANRLKKIKGRKQSDQEKQNRVKSLIGLKRTEEQKLKMRDSNTQKRSVLCYDLNGNFLMKYDSINDASRDLKIGYAGIIYCYQGKVKKCKKYIFQLYGGGDICKNIEPYKHPLKK